MKLDRKRIIAELLKTGKFGTVRFNSAWGKNKWSVYLCPKSDSKGVHFHISYTDNGFVSQDEYQLPHKTYYTYGLHEQPRLIPAKTPMGAINEVRQLLNDGYKVRKL